MRALYLGLAAAFSVVALALKLFDVSNLATVISLLVAGVFLVMGLKITADQRPPQSVELDDDRRATIRAMLDRGDEGAAVRQVQLWFRNVSPEEARRAVLELR
ncbi:hypothetical protein [Corynebacterium comes]|uniref:Uncharacterized protein n=1 Tax=Corynebacterium comes TaxID=2675218 RepID=A0A6B8W2W5_9CORY|nr:hypothetical protein [Corynebacterium comes]QGU05276.1 hypothetical protein CETAM_10135 [Corynebacterium comes]